MRSTVLCSLVAVLCSTWVGSAAAQPGPSPASLYDVSGFSLVLLLAPGKPNAPVSGLSPDEMKALRDADQLLPYKSFQKLDGVFLRGERGGTLRLRGPEGREYSCTLTAGPPYQDTNPNTVYVRIDVTDGSRTGSVLKSEFRITLGETVVVGTSRVKGADQALVLLLTAVPVVWVYKPGNGVTAPVLVAEAKPRYTAAAREARIQGTVTLECVILPDGSIGDVRVAKSLEPGLDQEAIKATRQWRFKPGTKDGKPVPVQVSIELTFSLR